MKNKKPIKKEDIKTDCIMYVEEKNKCNGLNRLECKNCKFYKPGTTRQKERYVEKMKVMKTYIIE